MSNDPTTTGPAPPLPKGMVPVLRRDVNLELTGRFEVAIYAGWVFVVFFYGIPETAAEARVPLSRFESEDEARLWAVETADAFTQNWGQMMGFETARHFNNIGRFVLYQMGRSPYSSLEDVIAAQTKQLEKNLREWFHLPVGRGHQSKWRTAKELGDVLLDILTEKNPALTWDGLREELNAREPERTPASGGALRVLAGRFDLKLRALRKEAVKRRRRREREAKKLAPTP